MSPLEDRSRPEGAASTESSAGDRELLTDSVTPRRRRALPLDPDACKSLVTSDRWLSRITVTDDGCWICGYSVNNGYPSVWLGRTLRAHRVALVAALGRDLRPGMEAGHICHDLAIADGRCRSTDAAPCDHRRCVNPEHLAEQTRRENTLAGGTINAAGAARTHCPRGHSLLAGDPDADLRPADAALGHRACRTCSVQLNRESAAAVRAARDGLGMVHREYCALFGSSRRTAETILARLDSGIRPDVIVAGARAALLASDVHGVDSWIAGLRETS